jgi:signal transduction histidine kinase
LSVPAGTVRHVRTSRFPGASWVDWLLDAAFVLLAVLAQVEVWTRPEAENEALLVVLTLVWTLAPLARRQLPFAAPMAALIAVGAMTFVADEYVAAAATSVIGLALVAGVLGAYNEPRVAAAGLALAWGVVALVAAQDPQENLVGSLVAGLVATACWLVGLGWYRRAAQASALRERAERAESERETAARVAVAEERARIARELHDVVAHSVSVMVLQAGAVRRLLRDDQAREREALDTVERTGREALAEMRRLLGVLRTPEEQAELAPQPGLSELPALVERTEAAGLAVELRLEGEPAPLPRGVDLSAYRIVQEALTNTLKHSGAGHAEVTVRYHPDAVDLEITDDGRGPAAGNGGGHGLVGMRERATLYGGELSAGAREGGGFVVRARLPLPAGES